MEHGAAAGEPLYGAAIRTDISVSRVASGIWSVPRPSAVPAEPAGQPFSPEVHTL
jgi:hypothetical protein